MVSVASGYFAGFIAFGGVFWQTRWIFLGVLLTALMLRLMAIKARKTNRSDARKDWLQIVVLVAFCFQLGIAFGATAYPNYLPKYDENSWGFLWHEFWNGPT